MKSVLFSRGLVRRRGWDLPTTLTERTTLTESGLLRACWAFRERCLPPAAGTGCAENSTGCVKPHPRALLARILKVERHCFDEPSRSRASRDVSARAPDRTSPVSRARSFLRGRPPCLGPAPSVFTAPQQRIWRHEAPGAPSQRSQWHPIFAFYAVWAHFETHEGPLKGLSPPNPLQISIRKKKQQWIRRGSVPQRTESTQKTGSERPRREPLTPRAAKR